MHTPLRGPNNLLILHQIINRTRLPFLRRSNQRLKDNRINNYQRPLMNFSLEDEIAETRPDMNIKVTTFTESKKFYYN